MCPSYYNILRSYNPEKDGFKKSMWKNPSNQRQIDTRRLSCTYSHTLKTVVTTMSHSRKRIRQKDFQNYTTRLNDKLCLYSFELNLDLNTSSNHFRKPSPSSSVRHFRMSFLLYFMMAVIRDR